MADELLNLTEYARRRGVSKEAVSLAVKHGRLKNSVSRDDKGNPKIAPALADQEWEANTDKRRGWYAIQNSKANAEASEKVSGTLSQSRAVREAYLARLAKLDFEERSGELIRVESVRSALASLVSSTREAILQVPARVAPVLAVENDPARLHDVLMEELQQALSQLASSEIKILGG